jgi:hypothetical protein
MMPWRNHSPYGNNVFDWGRTDPRTPSRVLTCNFGSLLLVSKLVSGPTSVETMVHNGCMAPTVPADARRPTALITLAAFKLQLPI